MAAQNAFTDQEPTSEDVDPGTEHKYGVALSISDEGTLKRTGNRWWCPSEVPTEPGWAVWDDTHDVLIVAQPLDPDDLTVNGWNDVPDLGQDYDLTGITSITVYGRWYAGRQPLDLTATFPTPGSGPDITMTTGIYGFGSLTAAPYSGGGQFDLFGFADVALEFGAAPSEVTLTPATVAVSGVAVTPVAQAVTVTLTPASATSSAVALAPAPLAVTVTITPAEATLSAVAVSPAPGAVTLTLTPAAVALVAVALAASPGPGAVTLTAAVLAVAAVRLTTGSGRPVVVRPNTGFVVRPRTGFVIRP